MIVKVPKLTKTDKTLSQTPVKRKSIDGKIVEQLNSKKLYTLKKLPRNRTTRLEVQQAFKVAAAEEVAKHY